MCLCVCVCVCVGVGVSVCICVCLCVQTLQLIDEGSVRQLGVPAREFVPVRVPPTVGNRWAGRPGSASALS